MLARVLVTLMVCGGLLTEFSAASSAETINFQGQLRDSTGAVWPGALVRLAFRIYDADGNVIQGPIQVDGVQVTNGFVTTNVNVGFPALDTTDQRFLTVAVNDGSEMQPRIELVRVPFAVTASSVRGHGPVVIGTAQLYDLAQTFKVNKVVPQGGATIDISPVPNDGTSNAVVRFFRNTDTTGKKYVAFLAGTNADSLEIHAKIGVGGEESIFQQGGGPFRLETGSSPESALYVRSSGSVGHQGGIIHHQGGTYAWQQNVTGTGGEGGVMNFHYVKRLAPNEKVNQNVLRLHADGRVIAQVLEITGGQDVAEPFKTSANGDLVAGTVVVIDRQSVGRLKEACEPYDKRVAGIISGAGGLSPGLTLKRREALPGTQQVALTGQVYALATAENGSIEPGDMLTTSGVPGHAMKATDPARCDGAVLGKAMTGLVGGQGLVLVLVNLQ